MTDSLESILWEWVDDWIIAEYFCPFAKPARQQHKINMRVACSTSWSHVIEEIYTECQYLLTDAPHSTSLIAITNATEGFYDYLNLLDAAQVMLEKHSLLGTFQLASFHPNYLFEGEDANSASHYSNRSPVPIIHILREDEVAKVIPSQQHADDIVIRNIQHLEKMGVCIAKQKLQQCQKRCLAITQAPSSIASP